MPSIWPVVSDCFLVLDTMTYPLMIKQPPSLLKETFQQPYFQQVPHLGSSTESVISFDHTGRRSPVKPDVFQTKAITTDAQFALLASGAGTGKSRVLAARIAYLVKQRGVEPSQVSYVTPLSSMVVHNI